ncbi:hypothetical protein BHM03_00012663 [Ensete ventricosum]|nr:hypothetical protein BHM03_00012663 [Ensete ventricosum]
MPSTKTPGSIRPRSSASLSHHLSLRIFASWKWCLRSSSPPQRLSSSPLPAVGLTRAASQPPRSAVRLPSPSQNPLKDPTFGAPIRRIAFGSSEELTTEGRRSEVQNPRVLSLMKLPSARTRRRSIRGSKSSHHGPVSRRYSVPFSSRSMYCGLVRPRGSARCTSMRFLDFLSARR